MQEFKTTNSNYLCYALAFRPVYKRILSGAECTTSYFELPPASATAQPLALRLREMAEAIGLVPQPTFSLATSTSSLNRIEEETSGSRRRTQSQRQEGTAATSPIKKSRSSEDLEQATRTDSPGALDR